YVITAYYSDLFWNCWETGYSNSMSATPMAFPMDNGILLVDETKDGSGGPVDPVDTLVDSFYHWALQNYSLTDYDYAESGAPELEEIRNYSTVIWHDDDYNEHLIGENIALLASLLISGGNVVISGWKTADYLPPFFLNNFLATDGVQIISTPDFLGAFGEDNYPYIDVNGDFVPPWDDRWAYVATFEDAQSENVLYRYESFSGDNDSLAVGLVDSIEAKNIVVLGFPLYFMQPGDVKAFYEKILSEFGENMGIYEPPQSYTELTLYQNFPNPFSTSTTISFNIPLHYKDDAEIEIYNLKGQLVKEFKIQSASWRTKLNINEVVWDGKDDYGKQMPSGIYFAKLSLGEESAVKKMILIR
ncbi:MAG: T9SS type A sorting domain-containing protein, partial [Candidatus Cloacimonadia bacterium]